MKKTGKRLTAYCLSYGTWTAIPGHWRDTFSRMKDLGFDAVALSFSESEMRYSRRAFEMQIAEAHRDGLSVDVIPSRIGGRLAGAPLMPSLWLAENPSSQVPDFPLLACIEDEKFREWSTGFLGKLFSDYAIDGLIWDEPKSPDLVSFHPASIARYGSGYTPKEACLGFADLLKSWTQLANSFRPGLTVSVFNMPHTSSDFTRACSGLPEIDYAGFDGGLCLQSFFHESPTKHKKYLTEMWPRTVSECSQTGCGSFALIENMLMPRSQQDDFAVNLTKFLEMAQPDHLACYYYAHNNEDPDGVQKLTMDLVQKLYLKR